MRSELRLALPKGHIEDAVTTLLEDAGITIRPSARGYRPDISLPDTTTKLLKPQNIVEMLMVGRRDVGFAGADWVDEFGADVVEVIDTGLDPVSVVACASRQLAEDPDWATQRLLIASEYESLTRRWIKERGLDAQFVRSYGATEVFPPEDADLIVDNRSTGATLEANNLTVVDTLLTSSTRLYASREAWSDPHRKQRIEELAVLIESVLEARRRVMVEVNVSTELLANVVSVLPCMRQATVAPLHGNSGCAVRAAVLRSELPMVIPQLKSVGATDIVVTEPSQIVP